MGGGSAPRIRVEHGQKILAEMRAAFTNADTKRPTDQRLEPPDGVYVEVTLRPDAKPLDTLDRKREDVRTGAIKREDNEDIKAVLYVPDDARPVLEKVLEDYRTGPLSARGKQPPNKSRVDPIESIRSARLESFWTDDLSALPQANDEAIWWEIWSYPRMDQAVFEASQKLNLVIAENHYWLHFPETTVLQVKATRVEIELLLFATGSIAELRRASASPVYFLDKPEDQNDWSEDFANRVVWPNNDAIAICLLDTGVNRGHMLIEPALSPNDTMSVNKDWGSDDHHGHGTGMAGLSLHGDLLPSLQDQRQVELNHRLESVKMLPPNGFAANDPQSYGSITLSAISLAETNNPGRKRLFCSAITNENVSGLRASTWSAAIDQAAFGLTPDEQEEPKRLILISAGNIKAEIDATRIQSPDETAIEDPAQAWNAITVGGYTNKTMIDDEHHEDWQPISAEGDISPFSRTSIPWPQNKTAIKPDIVMEAGNRALNPAKTQAATLESLSLLTTSEEISQSNLKPFAATSAAVAQASRLAAEISASNEEYWPETVRALLIHSAQWTPIMRDKLENTSAFRDRYPLLRKYGHGVANADRAIASATNDMALIAQNHIQPFLNESGSKRFGDSHYYKLPWPQKVLEGIADHDVQLKITLSYFIEPNPGRAASIDPQRYQSFGLRFDLKGRQETEASFLKRTNALHRENPRGSGPERGENSGWMFGANSISAGSLHSDVWTGPAIQLASRNILCIKPVTGWWKDSAQNCQRKARYSLIATLSAPSIDVDLYTPIENIVENTLGVEIPV